MTRIISFTLPKPYPLLNHSIGQSRFALTNMRRSMARSVAVATAGQRLPEPMQRAHVTIERHSVGQPDHDGVVGGANFLIDCLTTPRLLNVRKPRARQRVRNTRGHGFILDACPKHITLVILLVNIRHLDQTNYLSIWEHTDD